MDDNRPIDDFTPHAQSPEFTSNKGGSLNLSNVEGSAVHQQAFSQQTESDLDIVLDPELDSTDGAEMFRGIDDDKNSRFYNRPPVEPMPPLMPRIEENEFIPSDPSKTARGIKVFAIIVALIVVISACVTGGYFLGKSQLMKSSVTSAVSVDLATKPLPKNAKTVSQVYNDVSPSVVGIHVYSEKGIIGTASGVIYSADGYIVTNDHIYADVPLAQFKVYTSNGKMFDAKFVAGDSRSDLAVLKIDGVNNLKPAIFGNSDQVVTGEYVVAIGRPNGATDASVASEGVVSIASTRVSITTAYSSKLIQTDTAINPGSSGGALSNIYGQVIGITSAKLIGSEYDGVGYAIPSVTVKTVVDSLIKYGKVCNRAKLGISYEILDGLTAEISYLPSGLRIIEISKDSDLYGKSIKKNDIITHVNDVQISNCNLVLDIIDKSKPGDTISLKVYSFSKGKYIDISVKLLEDTGTSSYVFSNSEE